MASETPRTNVPVTIRALIMDPVSQMPVVILKADDRNAFLPIWIGVCEANAIALQMEGVQTPRPMTHDLFRHTLEATGHRLDRVFIHSISDSVFIASLHLVAADGDPIEVDSRPSDALAIALRTGSPVFVADDVLREAEVEGSDREDAMRMVLERLRPEDLGEYEM